MSMPKMVAKKLTTVLEKIFADFQENIDDAARNCENHDASTALYGVSTAIDMLDLPYLVRDALEIPHDDIGIDPDAAGRRPVLIDI